MTSCGEAGAARGRRAGRTWRGAERARAGARAGAAAEGARTGARPAARRSRSPAPSLPGDRTWCSLPGHLRAGSASPASSRPDEPAPVQESPGQRARPAPGPGPCAGRGSGTVPGALHTPQSSSPAPLGAAWSPLRERLFLGKTVLPVFKVLKEDLTGFFGVNTGAFLPLWTSGAINAFENAL